MSHDPQPADPAPEQPPVGQPACGAPQQPQPAYGVPVAPSHPSATVALVLGILSLVCLGFLSGIPAIIMGRKAVREIDASQGQLGGRGSAQAGWITGLIGTVLSVLSLVLIVGLAVFGVLLANDEDCSIQGDVPTYVC